MNIKIKRYLDVGPGGIKCPCCFPGPGKRKKEFRKAKRRAKRDAFKDQEISF